MGVSRRVVSVAEPRRADAGNRRVHAASHDHEASCAGAAAVKRPSVGACALIGALIFFLPVVVAKSNEYEGSDVIVYGGSVLALVGAALGTVVGLLVNLRR